MTLHNWRAFWLLVAQLIAARWGVRRRSDGFVIRSRECPPAAVQAGGPDWTSAESPAAIHKNVNSDDTWGPMWHEWILELII